MLCLALQEVPAVEFLAIFEAARRVPSVREIVTPLLILRVMSERG